MKVKIPYLLSLLSGIVATVSIFLTYASVKVVGYDTGESYNGLDLRDIFMDYGGNWFNGIAEFAIIFILIFGVCNIAYTIGLFIRGDRIKNVPLNFVLNGLILLILSVVVVIRVGQVDVLGVSLAVGYGLYIAIEAAVINIIAGVLEFRDLGKLITA
jgi:hypothetical protein